MSQKAPSRIHFIARSSHLCGTKGEQKGAQGSRARQVSPRGCCPRFFSVKPPGDPKLSRNADATLREGTIPSRGCRTNAIGGGLREEAGTVRPSLPRASAHTGTRAWPAAPRRDTPKMCPGVGARYGFVLFYRVVKQASDGGKYF